jgi:hypothetical protein
MEGRRSRADAIEVSVVIDPGFAERGGRPRRPDEERCDDHTFRCDATAEGPLRSRACWGTLPTDRVPGGLGPPDHAVAGPAQLVLSKLYVPSQFQPFVTVELAVTVTLASNPAKAPVPPAIVHSPRPSAKPR